MKQQAFLKGFSAKENLVLSPIEKHIYYNKFPWRLILNLVLVMLVTIQLSFLYDIDASFSREEQRTFRYMFLEKEDDHEPTLEYTNPSELQKHLKKVEENFQNFNDFLFQDVILDGAVFKINVNYKTPSKKSKTFILDLEEGFKEPFDISDEKDTSSLKAFLLDVVQFEIVAENLTVFNSAEDNIMCRNWQIVLEYDLESFSQVEVSLRSESTLCDDYDYEYVIAGEKTSIGISFVVVILGCWSLLLALQKINKVSNVFLQLKAGYMNYKKYHLEKDKGIFNEQAQKFVDEAENPNAEENLKKYLQYESWEAIPISVKLKFYNPWFFLNIIGNIFQIISSAIVIVTFFSPISAESFYIAGPSLGFSAFFSWFQLLQYLKFWREITLITDTIYESASNLKVYFGIFLPLFFGFGLFGISLFWKYDKFSSFGISLRSLYEMGGGDIVHETYLETWDEGFLSTLFLTFYMIIFFTALMNILVAIIMEGYDRSVAKKDIPTDPLSRKKDQLKKTEDLLLASDDDEKKDSGYRLREKIDAQLNKTGSNSSVKHTLNLLLYHNERAKTNIAELMKIRRNIKRVGFDETTQLFLHDLLASTFNKILEKISYFRLSLNKNPLKSQKGF